MRKSKTEIVAEAIRADYVDSRRCAPKERLPSVRELQARYSVSSSATVSHALSLLVQIGLLEKMEDGTCCVAECFPIPTQNSLKLLGFVMPGTWRGIVSDVHEGIELTCRAEGYHVMTGIAGHDYENERVQVTRLVDAGCQGIVLFPSLRTSSQLANDYLKTEFQDVPIVLVDLAYPEQNRSMVVFDNYRAAYEMTTRLIKEGHRRIAFTTISQDPEEIVQRSVRDRYAGYLRAMKHAGLPTAAEDLWVTDMRDTNPGTIRNVRRWMDQTSRASALIALNDDNALFVISVAQELGISIPDDLQIVGFDNQADVSKSSSVIFPTTNPDFRQAGEIAANLAIRHAETDLTEPVNYMLPVEVLWRNGSAVRHHQLTSAMS